MLFNSEFDLRLRMITVVLRDTAFRDVSYAYVIMDNSFPVLLDSGSLVVHLPLFTTFNMLNAAPISMSMDISFRFRMTVLVLRCQNIVS
jgi:hypothetical protein